MTNNDHPHSLEDFINGLLSDEENEAILTHLVTCQACETKVERMWEATPIGIAHSGMPVSGTADAADIEESLFRKIHRSELGGQFIKFYTQGFLGLISMLLHPIVSNIRRPKSSGG